MTDPIDDENEESARRKKKDEGEGDSDSWGRGKAGSASGMARLSDKKAQEVKGERRHLVGNSLIESIVEFFSELPLRASATASLEWVRDRFAIINHFIDTGKEWVRDYGNRLDQRRTNDQQRHKPGMGMNPGPAGPTAQ